MSGMRTAWQHGRCRRCLRTWCASEHGTTCTDSKWCCVRGLCSALALLKILPVWDIASLTRFTGHGAAAGSSSAALGGAQVVSRPQLALQARPPRAARDTSHGSSPAFKCMEPCFHPHSPLFCVFNNPSPSTGQRSCRCRFPLPPHPCPPALLLPNPPPDMHHARLALFGLLLALAGAAGEAEAWGGHRGVCCLTASAAAHWLVGSSYQPF